MFTRLEAYIKEYFSCGSGKVGTAKHAYRILALLLLLTLYSL